MKNPSLEVDATEMEFLRDYDPAVTYWGLTPTGIARVESGVFPQGIGVKGPGAMRLLKKLETAEEDEIGGIVGLTPGGTKRLLKRLAGFGLVAQAT